MRIEGRTARRLNSKQSPNGDNYTAALHFWWLAPADYGSTPRTAWAPSRLSGGRSRPPNALVMNFIPPLVTTDALWRRLLRRLLPALMLAAVCGHAMADAYTEVNRLTSSGQLEKALAQANAYLAEKPRDPQMRFLKGVALSESGRKQEAEEVFLLLTREYPELPEPYNNLAVLLAERQQFDQARLQLEAALRNDPAYATAHENLGDVLAQLAAVSYARALQIEPGRASIRLKLDRLRQMFNPDRRP